MEQTYFPFIFQFFEVWFPSLSVKQLGCVAYGVQYNMDPHNDHTSLLSDKLNLLIVSCWISRWVVWLNCMSIIIVIIYVYHVQYSTCSVHVAKYCDVNNVLSSLNALYVASSSWQFRKGNTYLSEGDATWWKCVKLSNVSMIEKCSPVESLA